HTNFGQPLVANGKAKMALADGDPVAVLVDLTCHAFAVHEYTVGALEVLDGGVIRAGEQHRVVAADVLGIEDDLVVGTAADAGPAAENVHEIGIAVGADQDAGRPLERHLFAGLRRAVQRVGTALLEIGLELLDAAVALQDRTLALGDDRTPFLDCDTDFLELAGLVPDVELEVANALLGDLQRSEE